MEQELPFYVIAISYALLALGYCLQIRKSLVDTVTFEQLFTFYALLVLIILAYAGICLLFMFKSIFEVDLQSFGLLLRNNLSATKSWEKVIKPIVTTFLPVAIIAELIAEFCLPHKYRKKSADSTEAMSDKESKLLHGLWLALIVAFITIVVFLITRFSFSFDVVDAFGISVAIAFLIFLFVKSIFFLPKDRNFIEYSSDLGHKELTAIKWFAALLTLLLIMTAYQYLNAKYLNSKFYEPYLTLFFFAIWGVIFDLALLGSIYITIPIERDKVTGRFFQDDNPNRDSRKMILLQNRERNVIFPVIITLVTFIIVLVCFFVDWERSYPPDLKTGLDDLRKGDFSEAKSRFKNFLNDFPIQDSNGKNKTVIHPLILKAKTGLAISLEQLSRTEPDTAKFNGYWKEAHSNYLFVDGMDKSYGAGLGMERIRKLKYTLRNQYESNK